MGSFVFACLPGAKVSGREVKQTTQTGLTSPRGAGAACGRAAGRRYGGTGVMIVFANGAGLPSSGISTSAANTLVCKNTDVASALRRTPRSRLRCSGSPSTKQPCSEPICCAGEDKDWESSGITHLHRFLRATCKNVCDAGPNTLRMEPAPRSQGCEVCARPHCVGHRNQQQVPSRVVNWKSPRRNVTEANSSRRRTK